MKHIILASTTILATMGVHQNFASDRSTLDDILKSPNPLSTLKSEVSAHPENAKQLCEQIIGVEFYQIAQQANLGVIKRNTLISFCHGVEFEKANLKKATQKPKQQVKKIEMPKLRPVELGKQTQDISAERENLREAQQSILENAQKLGQQKKYEQQLQAVTNNINQAQEFYDNLSAVIMVMREDLKNINLFKIFNPNDHDSKTPEEYIVALKSALEKERNDVLDTESHEQLKRASQLLKDARKNLENARKDLERINKEMLELTSMH